MSLQAITLAPEYNYVIAVAATSSLVHLTHFRLTSKRRYAAKIPYPIAYVPQAEADKDEVKAAFNAAQKAQANFTENYPAFLVSLATAGLHYPVAAAGVGATWVVGRLLYAWGYSRIGRQYTTNGKGRNVGAWSYASLLVLMGMGIYGSVKAVL